MPPMIISTYYSNKEDFFLPKDIISWIHTWSFGLCKETQRAKTWSMSVYESFVFWVLLRDLNDPNDLVLIRPK